MGKVVLHYSGFRQLRQSQAIQNELTRQAQAMASRANAAAITKGAQYTHAPAIATDVGSVALATTGHGNQMAVKAMIDQAKHDTLLKAVSG